MDKNEDKDSLTHILKLAAYEIIDSFPDSAIKMFTDGSAFKATVFAGYGVHIKFPDGSSENLSEPCGNICSNYTAEIKAIKTAIETVHNAFETGKREPSDLVIFTDSKSALEALGNHQSRNQDIAELANSISRLHTAFEKKISLQWIPGHADVAGNETADRLAKCGAQKEQYDTEVSQETVKQILKNNSKEEWNMRWITGTTGRSVFSEMTKPNSKDSINQLNRADQCLIFQLRTGNCRRLNLYLNRINPMHPPNCRHCDAPYETTQHVLLECTGSRALQRELLPALPTIQNTLYTSYEQLTNTCKFVRLALALKE